MLQPAIQDESARSEFQNLLCAPSSPKATISGPVIRKARTCHKNTGPKIGRTHNESGRRTRNPTKTTDTQGLWADSHSPAHGDATNGWGQIENGNPRFFESGRPRVTGKPSQKVGGRSPPIFWQGFPGSRGHPDSTNLGFPVLICPPPPPISATPACKQMTDSGTAGADLKVSHKVRRALLDLTPPTGLLGD